MLMIEVGEDHLLLHPLYNWGSNVTLVLSEAACMAGLQHIRKPKRRVRGFEGKMVMASTCL
jgi:hypothetical protein